MKFRVTHFDSQRGVLMLMFDNPSTAFTLTLPIGPDNKYLTGDELIKYITDVIPAEFFRRLKTVQHEVSNNQDMVAMLGAEYEINDDDVYARAQPLFAIKEAAATRVTKADLAYINQLIDEALVKKGIE